MKCQCKYHLNLLRLKIFLFGDFTQVWLCLLNIITHVIPYITKNTLNQEIIFCNNSLAFSLATILLHENKKESKIFWNADFQTWGAYPSKAPDLAFLVEIMFYLTGIGKFVFYYNYSLLRRVSYTPQQTIKHDSI